MRPSDPSRPPAPESDDEVSPEEAFAPLPPSELETEAASDEEGYANTLSHGVLSPRHRRLAQLAAAGLANQKIAEELGYSGSRVSILLRNPHVAAEIARLQEKIFEESVTSRLKDFAEPALAILQRTLTDRTGRVKNTEQIDVAKWVVEKLDGKATQKHDIGENMLGVLMDRLDAMKTSGRQLGAPERQATCAPAAGEADLIDVTPQPPPEKSEEDLLDDWVMDYDTSR